MSSAVKVSIAATNARAPGGQFVLHAKALPGNPYDGHTLRAAIEGTEKLTGREIERAYVDKGYRGHNAPNPHRVFISGQKRGVFGAIKRELSMPDDSRLNTPETTPPSFPTNSATASCWEAPLTDYEPEAARQDCFARVHVKGGATPPSTWRRPNSDSTGGWNPGRNCKCEAADFAFLVDGFIRPTETRYESN
jgi:hypothetical protein